MTVAFGAAAVLIAAALLPLLCGGLPATLILERAFPVNKPANLTLLADRDRVRHGRMLQSANGVIDFQVGGSYDPFQVGLYYTKVQLGTPPRDFYVQIDTGSDVLWVSCSSCNGCPETTGLHEISLAFFDPRSSSSAKLVSCSDQRCTLGVQASDSGCSTQNNLCSYSFQYGDGSGTSGYYVADLLNFDSIVGSSLISNSTAPVVFGCSTVQSGDLTKSDRAVDGIFGFGQQGLSVVSQLASLGVAPKAFSHCLRGDGDGGGILVLGEIIEPSIVYSPLVPMQPHYNLNLQSISVNGQMLPIDPSVFSTSSNRGTIIDSGTTLAYLTDEAYDPFLSAINAAVSSSARPILSRGNQCYLITSSLTDVFPQINLNFEGATMALGPQDYLLQQSSIDGAAVWCIGFQKLQGQGITILGDIVLKNKIFVYDLAGQRIGWANYDCSMAVNVSADMKTGKSEFVNTGELSSGIRGSLVPLNFIMWSVTLTAFLVHTASFMLQCHL